ncbi:Gp49 family protein [Variovorax sp. E3]|uniref:Gp49 family protein n=1 Tax=Variovorax sp. E3 TaxID=1914993 RepID=UPI0018DE3AE4|nr:Gp49 family protein [Variovorax sp. E3]
MNHPSARDASDEALIQSKGKTAPRVTPTDIAANIISEHFFTAAEGVTGAAWVRVIDEQAGSINAFDAAPPPVSLGLLTFCVLVLRNGFTVTGESACASPENFDVEIGRKIARDNAVQKVWPLMGYELKQRLSERA